MTDRKHPDVLALDAEAQFVFAAAGSAEEQKLPTFELRAYRGGPMRVSAWMDPVVIDLAGLDVPGQQIPVRRGHDPRQLVGHTDKVTVSTDEVTASGVVSFENAYAREVVAAARNGFKWQVSVGVAVHEVQYLSEKDTALVNGRALKGPMDIVRKGTLKEISFVDLGADSTTSAKVAAEQAEEANMTKTEVNGGGDAGGGTAQATKVEASSTASGVEAIASIARAETARQAKIAEMITAAVAQPGADIDALERIGKQAVSDRWDAQRTESAITKLELDAMRSSRAQGPAIHSRSEPVLNDDVLAAAVLLSLGTKHEKVAKDPDFGERVAEAAWKHRDITLHGLIAAALKAEGISPPHGGQQLFQAAMERSIRAGFSTVNLPGILGTVGNKLLLDSFTAVNAIYPNIAQQSDFNNFLTYTQYRLNDVGAFASVGQDGEIKNGSLSQDSYTNTLTTRGQMLTLTRQQIINDDLGALQQLYGLLGRKAALAVERATCQALMEASDVFYTSARGNRLTTSALSITNLAAAEAAMAAQLDADSEPIYAAPAILLVPPGLKFIAQQIYTSAAFTGGSSGRDPIDNPFRGRFQVYSSPYLALAALSGALSTTWYLLADPNNLPAVQVAFLRGQRAPTIETADSSFNTLGMQMRCYFDFGVAQVDYRGAVKATA